MTSRKTRVLPLTDALKVFFGDALKIAIRNPGQAWSFFRTVRWQSVAARRRSRWAKETVHVPPIIIFSVTSRCNLECAGCYDRALHGTSDREMSDDKVRRVITEADELGVSFFVLAGGEPLLRPEILRITADFPRIIFLLFTNGLLIDDAVIAELKRQKNLVPMISLDGGEAITDSIRGEGTFRRLREIAARLKRERVFFGTSLTMTRPAFAEITDRRFIGGLVEWGFKFFLFLEYTSIEAGTEDWVLDCPQRDRVRESMESFRKRFPALFIAVPWDEDDVGGCLAAGRGFVHVNAAGDVEPCPFAPFSDTNLRDGSLREALRSDLLAALRRQPELLKETGGGCGLWKNRERVESILNELKAKNLRETDHETTAGAAR